jgi:hypothetical protein
MHEDVPRKWLRDAAADPQHAFRGQGVMKHRRIRSAASTSCFHSSGRPLPEQPRRRRTRVEVTFWTQTESFSVGHTIARWRCDP